MNASEPFTESDLAEMVSRLAHKIRNPLATIKTSVQLVEHLTRPTGDIAEYLESAVQEVARIDVMLREMQTLVRMERAGMAEYSVAELVADCLEARCESCDEVHVQAGAPARVRTDPELFSVALAELVSNARRFSEQGAPILVRWETGADGRLRLHVEDAGPGIPDQLSERILRPFFSTSTQGSGLGLNIAAKAMELAEGGLEWNNLECGGSRFTLVLPLAEIAALLA